MAARCCRTGPRTCSPEPTPTSPVPKGGGPGFTPQNGPESQLYASALREILVKSRIGPLSDYIPRWSIAADQNIVLARTRQTAADFASTGPDHLGIVTKPFIGLGIDQLMMVSCALVRPDLKHLSE